MCLPNLRKFFTPEQINSLVGLAVYAVLLMTIAILMPVPHYGAQDALAVTPVVFGIIGILETL
jgi:hypothetical protein